MKSHTKILIGLFYLSISALAAGCNTIGKYFANSKHVSNTKKHPESYLNLDSEDEK